MLSWQTSQHTLQEDFLMTKKPTHEELEQRVKGLEKKAVRCKQADEVMSKFKLEI